MNSVRRGLTAGAVVATVIGGYQLTSAVAVADPEGPPQPVVQESPQVLRNIIYRARIDGVSRGATITYSAEGNQTQTANPTMVPGRVFEVNTVLPETDVAAMKVSVQWPYSANLHCEILVDEQIVAQADDFVAPRFLPQDPDYAALTCEAPVATPPPAEPPLPVDPAAPVPPGV